MNLNHFILEAFDFDNTKHIKCKDAFIASEGASFVSSDIERYIRRNHELHLVDGITNTYVIYYENQEIGLAFANYHREEKRDGILLPEEIEIGAGLLPLFRGKKLGALLERELAEELLLLYPRFPFIVGRIDDENKRSIHTAYSAGFLHIEKDEYHFKRK